MTHSNIQVPLSQAALGTSSSRKTIGGLLAAVNMIMDLPGRKILLLINGKNSEPFPSFLRIYYVNDKSNDKEVKMRLREKIGILALALFLSFAAFSMIAAPAIDLVKVGKYAGYEIISNVLAKADTPLVYSLISRG